MEVISADYVAIWGQNTDSLPTGFSACEDWNEARALAEAIVYEEPIGDLYFCVASELDNELYARFAWMHVNIADAHN
jgi:hypothetical protein